MASSLRYRGLSYDPRNHEQLSDVPVEHIYRGQHYSAPLRHRAAPMPPRAELRYRGIAYQHHPSVLPSGC